MTLSILANLAISALAAALLAPLAAVAVEEGAERAQGPIHVTNGQVTNVDPSGGKLRLQGEDGEIVLEARPRSSKLARVRRGDSVVVGYRVQPGRGGRAVKVLTALEAAETVRVEARSTARVESPQALEGVRVTHVDVQAPALGVEDSSGTIHVLSTSPDLVPVLRQILPGDVVDLRLGGGEDGVGQAVVQLQRVGRTEPRSPTIDAPPEVLEEEPEAPSAAPAPPTTGIPLRYVVDSVPSVPPPAQGPNMALPPSSAAHGGPTPLAAHDLERAAAALGQAAQTLDRIWEGYRQLCITAPLAPTAEQRDWFRLRHGDLPEPDRDDCRMQKAELERMSQEFHRQVTIAAQTALGGGVLPGEVRAILARHRVDIR